MVGGGWEAGQFHRWSRQSGDVPPPGEPGPRHVKGGGAQASSVPRVQGPVQGAPRLLQDPLWLRGSLLPTCSTEVRAPAPGRAGRRSGSEWEGPQMTDHRLCDPPCVHPQNRPTRPSRSCCLRRWSDWREAGKGSRLGTGTLGFVRTQGDSWGPGRPCPDPCCLCGVFL